MKVSDGFVRVLFVGLFLNAFCFAVTSKVVRHSSSADFLGGEVKDVIVSSDGTLRLGRSAEVLADEFEDVWSINSIVTGGGEVFIGTSPNGGVYKYSLGEVTRIYPAEEEGAEVGDINDVNDANEVVQDEYMANEHIFAMAKDVAGRLLVGISGEDCRLMRYEGGEMGEVFEPADANYIFAIAVGDDGDIYLGTGPLGKVYRLDSLGANGEEVYDSDDKNILSLAVGGDGFVYAGSDERGLIYRIDAEKKTASVLYDSDEPEIAALLVAESGELFAAGTSAKMQESETEFALQAAAGGRPEGNGKGNGGGNKSGGVQPKIANGKKAAVESGGRPGMGQVEPGAASVVYKVSDEGFVTKEFVEKAVFLCLGELDGELLLGTGNKGRVFSIAPAEERQAAVYVDEQSSQVAAISVAGSDVYLGCANPAKLVKLSEAYSGEGEFVSGLVDAGQPAKWGKIQIDADIPAGCEVFVASRSGNVGDVNDKTFSEWTAMQKIVEPVELGCPVGRYCQYKLVLRSEDGEASAVIREVAVASTVGNLSPKVEAIEVGRVEGKAGVFKIDYKANDDNDDELVFKIEFRKAGRELWIEVTDDVTEPGFEWDSRTVEDGRYEIRVTASDERSNSTTDAKSGSRVSDVVVVDNTGPVVSEINRGRVEADGGKADIRLELKVTDAFSAIGKLEYTVDSNEKWRGTVCEDGVFDTTEERFVIEVEGLGDGEHVLAVRASDAVGNVTYKSFEF